MHSEIEAAGEFRMRASDDGSVIDVDDCVAVYVSEFDAAHRGAVLARIGDTTISGRRMGSRIGGTVEEAIGYVAVERPDWVPNLVDHLVAEPRRDRTDEGGPIAGDRHD